MIKQSHKNSLNNSFLISFKHTNQPIPYLYSTHTQKHNPNYYYKKRSQSFMSQNIPYDKLTKQLKEHKNKHNSSFNQSLNTKNHFKQLTQQTKKQQKSDHTRKSSLSSTTKHKKQRTISSIISQQQKHKKKGEIRKNNCKQNISYYQSNKDHHLNSINSNLLQQTNKMRRKQNISLAVRRNVQQQNKNHDNDDVDLLKRQQDNIKTDYQQRPYHAIQFKKKNALQNQLQQQKDQYVNSDQYLQQNDAHKENINPNININNEEIQKLDQMTSKRISQLQSKSQTIDLLKFTIKTKLSKDILDQSSHCLNSLMSSDNKSAQRQYIDEILKLKDLQTNFYIDKITSLQNQLNKSRKQRKSLEQEIYIKCNQDNRKNIIEKIRYQEENQLLKRENEALRSIILKKINKC